MKLQGCIQQLLADTVLKMVGGVLEFDTVQRNFMCLVGQGRVWDQTLNQFSSVQLLSCVRLFATP